MTQFNFSTVKYAPKKYLNVHVINYLTWISVTNNESGLGVSPQQGNATESAGHASSTCLAMGSSFTSCSSDSSGSQHHCIRYIYYISIQTLTGRHYDNSPDRDTCESPNPIRLLEKIRDIRDAPETLQFFPLSPS